MKSPFLSAGFRPFFLVAALCAGVLIPWWVGVFHGWTSPPGGISPSLWHGHELLFGFVMAVFAGFFLTAVPVWTKRPRITGLPLVGLLVLWIAGRVAILAYPALPPAIIASIDLAFVPVLALAIAVPILRARSWRNILYLPAMAVITAGNAMFHAEALGFTVETGAVGLRLCLDAMLVMLVLVSGRILPFFTRRALEEPTVHQWPVANWISMVSVVGWALLDPLPVTRPISAVFALVAAVALLARTIPWKPWRGARVPLLGVLYVGWAWLAVGIGLTGMASLTDAVSYSVGMHALTAGALGTMTLGMMSRVALGHTGRKLDAHPAIVITYALVIVAGVVRVFGPWSFPEGTTLAFGVAGTLWCLAWLGYLIVYTPILFAPRADAVA